MMTMPFFMRQSPSVVCAYPTSPAYAGARDGPSGICRLALPPGDQPLRREPAPEPPYAGLGEPASTLQALRSAAPAGGPPTRTAAILDAGPAGALVLGLARRRARPRPSS